jgi:hypothetical protein
MPIPLALGAAGALAVLSLASRRRGSRGADAHLDLAYLAEGEGDLAEHYPQTAAGRLEPGRGEDVFWAGRGYRKIGYIGPTDGTMVPIDARYADPISGNIFYPEKLSALVAAVQAGDQPVVDVGYAELMLLSQQHVTESVEYSDERPWEAADVGDLYADVRDGNHRTMAALISGAPFTWVRMSASTKQDLVHIPKGREAYTKRLYAAIRRAQREAGVPVFQRPRRRRKSQRLIEAEAQYDRLMRRERELYRALLRDLEDMGDGRDFSMAERLERAQTFLRSRLRRAHEQGDEALIERYHAHPLREQKAQVAKQREQAFSRRWDLRRDAGLDPRTGMVKS